MKTFEQKYAYLLGFYPRSYRDRRGAEMLSVLAEGGRPSWRERGALAVNGLRVRLGGNADRTVVGSWLAACHLAALTLLLAAAAGELLRSASTTYGWVWAQAVVSVLALGLVWKHRYLLATLAAAAAVALDAIGRHGVGQLTQWEQPLAVLLLIPLIGRRRPAPPAWLALPLIPIAMLLEFPLFPFGYQWVALVVAAALILPLTVVDHRLGLAVALIGLLGILNQGWTMKSIFWSYPDMVGAMWIPTIWPLAVLVLGGQLARRRARA
jgi:hypothetical protein